MNNNWLINLVGWVGAFMLLLAYALVSTRKLAGDSFIYQVLNLAGSFCLVFNAFHYGAYPSVGVNSIWIGIAIFTLVKGPSLNQKEEKNE